jgi:hypothetical protein
MNLNQYELDCNYIVHPIRPAIVKSDPVSFIEDNSDKIFQAMALAEHSMPSVINTLQNRMQMPNFFNKSLKRIFKESIEQKMLEFVENQSHDWLLCGKKISNKHSHEDNFFSRPKKRGFGDTQQKPIQLKNTKQSVQLNDNEFDYLFFTICNLEGCGLYLLSMEQVKELLKNSPEYSKCDNNGFDGIGQIKLYISNKEDCLICKELSINDFKELSSDYQTIENKDRNLLWDASQDKAVEEQIELSLKNEKELIAAK